MIKMKTFVKIYGPPVLKSIEALEKIALDMPEVCIMDQSLQAVLGMKFERSQVYDYTSETASGAERYFRADNISKERCSTIISKSGEALGEYDFFFEWFKKPTVEEIRELIGKIDNALEPLGSIYTVVTK
jgi:hypothetical protein